MYLLGLRRFPPLSVILKLAADEDETLRSVALQYFLDNIAKYPEYNPSSFADLAFVPAVQPDGKSTMASPTRVFLEQDVALLGFLTVHPGVREVAMEKLKIGRHPPVFSLIPLLETSFPKDSALAHQWFEYLASRLTGTCLYLTMLDFLNNIVGRIHASTTKKNRGVTYCTYSVSYQVRERDQ